MQDDQGEPGSREITITGRPVVCAGTQIQSMLQDALNRVPYQHLLSVEIPFATAAQTVELITLLDAVVGLPGKHTPETQGAPGILLWTFDDYRKAVAAQDRLLADQQSRRFRLRLDSRRQPTRSEIAAKEMSLLENREDKCEP